MVAVPLGKLAEQRSSRREENKDGDPVGGQSILTVDAPPEANPETQGLAMRELVKQKAAAEGPVVVPKGRRPTAPTGRRPDESTAIGNSAFRTADIGRANDVDAFLENELEEKPQPAKAPKEPSRVAFKPAPKLTPGFEWLNVAMPSLAQARRALPPRCVTPAALEAFTALPPLEAYAELHQSSFVPQLGVSPPLPASSHESPEETTLRTSVQRRCRSYILPKAANETAEQFAARVAVRKPRTQSAPIKPPCLVFPGLTSETSADFELRMDSQLRVSVPVLPRGTAESREEFRMRMEALQDAGPQFNSLPRTTLPPLVLPKSKAETPEAFAHRLRVALEPSADAPLCPIILPRSHREEEEDAERRLALQLQLPAECLLPYDARAETREQYTARLDATEERLLEARRPAAQTRTRQSSSFSVAMGSMRSSVGDALSSLTRSARRVSRSSARRVSMMVGSRKGSSKQRDSRLDVEPGLATIQSSGDMLGTGGSMRNRLLDDDDGIGCCCCCLLPRTR